MRLATTFVITGLAALCFLPIIYLNMGKTEDLSELMLYGCAISFLGNAILGPLPIFLNERFPTSLRASGTGLSWNVGFSFGGMMPTFVSLVAGDTFNVPISLAVSVALGVVMFLAGALVAGETRDKDLAE